MIDKRQFVVLEGTHGAGKTTVAKILRDEYGFLYLQTPPPEYEQMREYMHSRANGLSRFLYYMAGNIDVSALIRESLRNTHVVCDRYISSTIASCCVDYGYPLEMLTGMVKEIGRELELPNRVFLLTVDADERLRRLQPRLEREPLFKNNPNLERISAIERTQLEMYDPLNWTVIDTSIMTAEDVAAKIVSILSA